MLIIDDHVAMRPLLRIWVKTLCLGHEVLTASESVSAGSLPESRAWRGILVHPDLSHVHGIGLAWRAEPCPPLGEPVNSARLGLKLARQEKIDETLQRISIASTSAYLDRAGGSAAYRVALECPTVSVVPGLSQLRPRLAPALMSG